MPDRALSLVQVLRDERAALQGQALPSAELENSPARVQFDALGVADLPDTYRALNADNRWALCLSGGGIRSASFALGILQCFANHRVVSKNEANANEPILQQFDYLSTVSGGGYIGSWLSAWLYQARRLAAGGQAGTVLANLNERIGDHAEVDPILNLRRNTHYLAPSFSAISADLWTDIAAIIRNLLLNWLLFLPPLILAVLGTKALAFILADIGSDAVGQKGLALLHGVSILFVVFALAFTVANRPVRSLVNLSQPYFLTFDLTIFILGSLLLVFALVTPAELDQLAAATAWLEDRFSEIAYLNPTYIPYVVGAIFGVGIYAISWIAATLWRFVPSTNHQTFPDYRWKHSAFDFLAWCVAGAVFGAIVLAGLELFQWATKTNRELAMLAGGVLGVPWMLMARIIGDVIFVVLLSDIPWTDSNLEYQSRSGGLYALTQLIWVAWFGFILLGSWLFYRMSLEFSWTSVITLSGLGGLSGAGSLIIGNSTKTISAIQATEKARRYLTLNTIAVVCAAIFAAVLIVGISIILDFLFSLWLHHQPLLTDHPRWGVLLFFALVLLVICGVVCKFININRYSLHGLYRNRLVRAFLGGSRPENDRELTKNHFTDFDTLDSPLIHQLWQQGVAPRGDNWQPLHIINVSLNLVSSKNLAWQERMAAPFTFSALHSGSGSTAFPGGAFRRSYPSATTLPYGGRLGLTLGTAMAISGAAVSPNMGYNSSPGVGFLMTLFNVRLGWWLGNPASGNEDYWRTGPRLPLRPFFMEMFGLTSEKEPWIYLSDGGHFENLGVYEMVRRRCRLIVVSDAGCDPEYKFDDLGNALRKVWIDLGIRVDFVGLDRLKKRFKERPTPAQDTPYWAVGRIRYRDADGGGSDGLLLYVKAGLHGTECMDVVSYASSHLEFPHETTANQFFTESQFESYRALGYEIAYRMLCYAERERASDEAAAWRREEVIRQPIDQFHMETSTLRVDQIIEFLWSNLEGS